MCVCVLVAYADTDTEMHETQSMCSLCGTYVCVVGMCELTCTHVCWVACLCLCVCVCVLCACSTEHVQTQTQSMCSLCGTYVCGWHVCWVACLCLCGCVCVFGGVVYHQNGSCNTPLGCGKGQELGSFEIVRTSSAGCF